MTTTYFFAITLTWPIERGAATWSDSGTFTADDTEPPVSRSEVLEELYREAADKVGAPRTASLRLFIVEPDEVR